MRDYRQEREIQDANAELRAARMREADLEARLRALESGQQAQSFAQQQQIAAQIAAQQAAAAAAAK